MNEVEKRSMTTDALRTLGTIIGEGEGRDAIHLAVEPSVAAHPLRPGDHVGFLPDGSVGICDKPVGIVDPFLAANVKTGERFWLVVYPRQITSLRHVWTHPAFPEAPVEAIALPDPSRAASEKWLLDFTAAADCPGYEAVMEAAIGHSRGDCRVGAEYLHFDGSDAHGNIPDEFWTHFEVVSGIKAKYRAEYFSCSC